MISDAKEKQISDLQRLLDDARKDTAAVAEELAEQRKKREELKAAADDVSVKDQITRLNNEKKEMFKQMLKEKKHVNEMDEKIDAYQREISNLEANLKDLKAMEQKLVKVSTPTFSQSSSVSRQSRTMSMHTGQQQYSGTPTSRFTYSARSSKQDKRASINATGYGGSDKLSVLAGEMYASPSPSSSPAAAVKLPVIANFDEQDDIDIFDEQDDAIQVNHIMMMLPCLRASMHTGQQQYGMSPYPSSFRVLVDEEDDKDNDESESEYEEDENDEIGNLRSGTMCLDEQFDPDAEAVHIYSWVHRQNMNVKDKKDLRQLKMTLASCLASRSEGFRQEIVNSYFMKYGKDLAKDVEKVLVKGNCLHLIKSLLLTRAEHDAVLIHECVQNWDIRSVADIICCRDLSQLRELAQAYNDLQKSDIVQHLKALARKEKKRTLEKVIGAMFADDRKEATNVDHEQVNRDLLFLSSTKNFKKDSKERLVVMLATRDHAYLRVFHDQFKIKFKDSLTTFIDKKLGPNSTAGHFCKTHVLYALDTPLYYADLIRQLGTNLHFRANQKKIGDIFMQRFEIDLYDINATWIARRYDDGKDLGQWVMAKTRATTAGHFMSKMVENSERYRPLNDMIQNKRTSKFEKVMISGKK